MALQFVRVLAGLDTRWRTQDLLRSDGPFALEGSRMHVFRGADRWAAVLEVAGTSLDHAPPRAQLRSEAFGDCLRDTDLWSRDDIIGSDSTSHHLLGAGEELADWMPPGLLRRFLPPDLPLLSTIDDWHLHAPWEHTPPSRRLPYRRLAELIVAGTPGAWRPPEPHVYSVQVDRRSGELDLMASAFFLDGVSFTVRTRTNVGGWGEKDFNCTVTGPAGEEASAAAGPREGVGVLLPGGRSWSLCQQPGGLFLLGDRIRIDRDLRGRRLTANGPVAEDRLLHTLAAMVLLVHPDA